uniref:'chromo' domain containing protein n=1 Tax=Solanum tuberosum TaxID=4113 RepID=M1DBH3_SOLTU
MVYTRLNGVRPVTPINEPAEESTTRGRSRGRGRGLVGPGVLPAVQAVKPSINCPITDTIPRVDGTSSTDAFFSSLVGSRDDW